MENNVVPETGKELQANISCKGEEEEEEQEQKEDGDNDDKNEVICLLCVQGLIFSTETSRHKSTS